jgi:adenylate cyclase
MVLEIQAMHLTTETLLTTFVGAEAGHEVLAGAIRRGDGRRINAVIWMCDLRNFTGLSEQHDQQAVLNLLNDFFEATVGTVEAYGGEVLKFIGDAILAIFPVQEGHSAHEAAERALDAALDSLGRLEVVNQERVTRSDPEICCGIGIHLGNVMYGNIGAPHRLDFTVIGPAVNLTTRIEALCGQLDRAALASAAIAALCPDRLEQVGTFWVKGVAEPQLVYGLKGSG